MEIKITHAGVKSATFSLLKETIVIGSDQTSDVIIDHPDIAPKHLQLTQKKDGRVTIKDLAGDERTLINEVGVSKDEEIEFTTFFPAQLGKSFTLELLNMTESERKTCVMVLNNPVRFSEASSAAQDKKIEKKAVERTHSSISKPPQSSTQTKQPARPVKKAIPTEFDDFDDLEDTPKKKTSLLAMVFGFSIMIFGVLYFINDGQIPGLGSNPNEANLSPVDQANSPNSEDAPMERKQASAVIDPQSTANIIKVIEIQASAYASREKCLSPKEKEFCDYLNSLRSIDYYEGALYIDGVLIMAINREAGTTFVSNQLEMTPDLREALKDSARKAMNERFKNMGPNGKELFDLIESKIQKMDNDSNFKLFNLPEGKISELILSFYLLNPEMISKVASKDYINFVVGICYNRKGGQTNVTALSVIDIKKIRDGVINPVSLKNALAKGLIAGVYDDYERDIKPLFDLAKDFSPGNANYEGPAISPGESLNGQNNNRLNNFPGNQVRGATTTPIYYSPSQNGR